MENSEHLIDLLYKVSVIGAFGVLITIQFKGILYDAERKKEDSKYSGNSTFIVRNNRVWFSFPIPITYKSTYGNLKKLTDQMNNRIIIFWMLVIIAIILYQLQN